MSGLPQITRRRIEEIARTWVLVGTDSKNLARGGLSNPEVRVECQAEVDKLIAKYQAEDQAKPKAHRLIPVPFPPTFTESAKVNAGNQPKGETELPFDVASTDWHDVPAWYEEGED